MLHSLYKYLLGFINITPEEWASINQFLEIRHFNKHVKLINIGEYERYVNFVNKGLVRKYFYRNQEEVITQIAKEGELICSSVSFLSAAVSDYVVETIEPTTVLSISRENMEKLYDMGSRMERMGRLVIIDWLIQKEYWENARIKQLPKERFLRFVSEKPDLLIRVPQKYLASYLNVKAETFSRYKRLLLLRPAPLQEPSTQSFTP
ncbi:MAG: cyclic nucleotide-binding domain-containing protein [Chitinophagaceae bacterium]